MENTSRLFVPGMVFPVIKSKVWAVIGLMLCLGGLICFSLYFRVDDMQIHEAQYGMRQSGTAVQSRTDKKIELSVLSPGLLERQMIPKEDRLQADIPVGYPITEVVSDRTNMDKNIECEVAFSEEVIPQEILPAAAELEMTIEQEMEETLGVPVPEKEETVESQETPLLWEVVCYGNGGYPETAFYSFAENTFASKSLEEPTRLGKVFDGWYEDAECTIPFGNVLGEEHSIALYAGWREFDGFTSDEQGYLMSCDPGSVADGLLVLPDYASCTGVADGAFVSVAELVEEIYIPANITYIAPGAMDELVNLLYVEVDPGNPGYYSENGSLYEKDGTQIW